MNSSERNKNMEEDLARELRNIVSAAGEVGNLALRSNSWRLYGRLVWNSEEKTNAQIIREVVDFAMRETQLVQSIWSQWQGAHQEIARAVDDLRAAVIEATEKFLKTYQENQIRS